MKPHYLIFFFLGFMMMLVSGCAPGVFGVSRYRWEHMCPEDQQETMIAYYNHQAVAKYCKSHDCPSFKSKLACSGFRYKATHDRHGVSHYYPSDDYIVIEGKPKRGSGKRAK